MTMTYTKDDVTVWLVELWIQFNNRKPSYKDTFKTIIL